MKHVLGLPAFSRRLDHSKLIASRAEKEAQTDTASAIEFQMNVDHGGAENSR
jgi:hypothetical protein